jgi:glutamine synthetase
VRCNCSFYKRPDLQLTGRTLIGKMPARGQELCDHYMSALSSAHPAFECMKEIQAQCLALGIPLKTRHREVAPNQYEMAPYFGTVVTQVDQNLVVMQIIEECAARFGLAALMQEKPFAGINGSGKHNNWSLSTTEGVQLMKPQDLNKASGNPTCFPAVMAAVVRGVSMHGDLMRMAISSPGNDFRLGAMEAPPAVITTFLGDSVTEYLKGFMENGSAGEYTPAKATVETGVEALGSINVPAEDRNRTSPFPYGGYRFEFRATGSTQNASMVNTVLCTMMADGFKAMADEMEGGKSAEEVVQGVLKENFKGVFNGNGYDPEWPDKAQELGIWRIDSGVDAINKLGDEKNLKLFSTHSVFTEAETIARKDILLEQYLGTVDMEVHCLINMLKTAVVPSCKAAGVDFAPATAGVSTLEAAWAAIEALDDLYAQAAAARTLRLETMVAVRGDVDTLEGEVPESDWSLASYRDLLFLDTHRF